MRDYILTFDTEADTIAALPECRVTSEDGEQWAGNVIADATRWITRPQYDEDGNPSNTPETVPGYHLIIRAEAIPEAAQPYIVADPGDIEPVPAGGLLMPEVPQVVSRFQARGALLIHGLLPDVEALMSDPSTPPLVVLAWQDAQEFRRYSPSVLGMAAALNWDDSLLDALFITASGIEA